MHAVQAGLERLGLPPAGAPHDVTARFAHTVDVRVLSRTGRIRMFRQASADLLETDLDQLLQRTPRRAGRTR